MNKLLKLIFLYHDLEFPYFDHYFCLQFKFQMFFKKNCGHGIFNTP